MISKLVLENWKSHLKSEFNFSEGTNVLVGIMGSGKSSVVDAISFALFGTFPDLQNRKIKLDDVIMNRPKKKDIAKVELTLVLDNVYTISRTVERGKGTTTSEIRENGKLLEAPQAQRVTEVVEKLLKLDYELFSRAIYSEQNQLDYFLTLPRGQRMKKIDELLHLDRFEKARQSSVSLVNRCGQRQKDLKEEVGRLKAEGFLEKIPDVESELNELEKRKAQMEKEVDVLGKRRERLQNETSKLEEKAEKAKELEREIASTEAGFEETRLAIERLKTSLKSLSEKPLEDMEKEYEQINKEMESTEKKIAKLRKELDKLQTKGSRVLAEIGQKKSRLDELKIQEGEKERLEKELNSLLKSNPKTALKNVEKEIDATKALIEKNKVILEQMKDSLEKISGKRCPVCDTPLTKRKREELVANREARMKDAQEKCEEAWSRLSMLEKRKERLESDVQRITLLKEKLKSMQLEGVTTLTKELRELRKEGKKIDFRLKSVRLSMKEMETTYKVLLQRRTETQLNLAQRKELEERLGMEKAYANRLKKLNETLKTLDFDPERLRLAREDLEKIIEESSKMVESINSVANLISEKKVRLKELKQRKKLLEEVSNEIEELAMTINFLQTFNQALLETQEELREEFIQAINETMDEIWSELYPYGDFQSIRYAVEEGDYVLQLRSGDTWLPVEGITSGGERYTAALCLRIALALVLAPNLRWIILDEPTHNLDSNAISSFAEVLRTKVSEIVDQVFVITHEERLEEAVTGVLYHLKRNKSENAPTEVEASS